MTEQEAYMWLGSCPCEDCDNCMIDENLNFVENNVYIKPRHYTNGVDMMETCKELGGCKEYQEYMKEYNKLISK